MKKRNRKEFNSTSGFVTRPYHNGRSLEDLGVEESTAFPPPGEYPFTRGFTKEGFRERFWAWEMYAGFGAAEDANRRYRFLLENGATGGVSVALDLPTQIGYDSDNPLAAGEVGKTGVALDTYSDIERLFDGMDLASAGHVFSTANCIGPVMYAWVLTFCERHNVDSSSFRLQIQNDPIKEYYARGTHFLPIDAAVRLATDVVVYSHHRTPNWLPISVSGSHMKQAGGSPAQEAAFTIANAIAYMEEVERKGVPLSKANPTLELHFCTDMDFFEEVAKYRAVRRAWSNIAMERFGVADISRLPFRLHAATSGLPLTAQQPMNNIARITLQALAQVLGGVEATRTASWDEALAIPTEEAAALSLRINQIIGHETGIADTTDPLGGSFYVEELTERIYRFISDEIKKIDNMGGALLAATNGYYADELANGAYRQQQALEAGERVIVGVNAYRQDEDLKHKRFTVDIESEQRQIDRLKLDREGRDEVRLRESLSDLRDACAGTDNVMPAVLAAVQSGATVGEVSDVWRETFGEYDERTVYV
jgi:methylmalonyl-CoA mutase, N-terminal domain